MADATENTDRPNILFVLTDQQRQDSMACYGNDWITTPNLNSIAERSFVFENAYVTQPVCTPSRASIMTGLYPHAVGLHRNNIPLPCRLSHYRRKDQRRLLHWLLWQVAPRR